MVNPNKQYQANFLKEETSPIFAEWFKSIIYNRSIPWGCKIYLLSTATLVVGVKPDTNKHGRKLATTGNQLRLWQRSADTANLPTGQPTIEK